MAFCSKCGAPVKDGAAFCQACGNKINAPETQNRQNYGSNPQPMRTNFTPISTAVQTLKKLCSSPLFLVAVIAFTLSIIFSIFGAFSSAPDGGILNIIYRIMGEAGIYDFGYGISGI